VDGGSRFVFDQKIDMYKVQPGRHTVQVFRNNQVIVDRTIIVDNHTTFEIDVP